MRNDELNPPPMAESNPFFGLIRRRICFLPTWRGWLLILILLACLIPLVGRSIYPFLALNQKLPADILVVEGWMPKYALEQAAKEFQSGHYRTLFVTGGVIEEGSLLADYKTYANLGGAVLLKSGFPADRFQIVPAPLVEKDRTYTSARALREWLSAHGGPPPAINIVSLGTHSRRTRLLFNLAFENHSQIGIIAVPNRDFNPSRWWHSSQGVRSVTDETVAYLYARLLFHPIRP